MSFTHIRQGWPGDCGKPTLYFPYKQWFGVAGWVLAVMLQTVTIPLWGRRTTEEAGPPLRHSTVGNEGAEVQWGDSRGNGDGEIHEKSQREQNWARREANICGFKALHGRPRHVATDNAAMALKLSVGFMCGLRFSSASDTVAELCVKV